MDSPERRVVLITGASHGIGLALGHALVKKNRYRLVLTARPRSLERLREAGFSDGPHMCLAPLDVVEPDQREEVVRAVTARWGGVDILVNNAGTMTRAVLEHVNEADHLQQMRVNYRAPMELTRLVLPGMRSQRFGRIINVSSVSGMMAMPTMSVYSASKFALEGASEALFYEVRPWNIRVSLVQPGFINSDAIERIDYTARSLSAHENLFSPYHAHYHYMTEFIGKLMHLTRATPTSVARRIACLIEQKHPPLRVSGTLDAFLFSMLRRLLPRTLYHEVLYRALPGLNAWGRAGFPERTQGKS